VKESREDKVLENVIKNVKEKSSLLRESLRINYPLIGISLGKPPPLSLPKLNGRMEFCKMWNKAFKGESFFVAADNHNCLTGQYYLGLRKWKEGVCHFLVDEVHAFNSRIVNKYLDEAPILSDDKTRVMCISPLDNVKFVPDVILVRCNPEQAMLLLWSHSHNTGEVINGETGTAMCISLVIKPHLNKKPSFSIGDPGGRYIIGLSEREIVASVPFQLFNSMVETLQSRLEDWKGTNSA
jgi:uncharacterized protein (DUF169 family)